MGAGETSGTVSVRSSHRVNLVASGLGSSLAEKPTRQGPEQPAVGDSALGRGLDYVIYRSLFQPQLFCGSVIIRISSTINTVEKWYINIMVWLLWSPLGVLPKPTHKNPKVSAHLGFSSATAITEHFSEMVRNFCLEVFLQAKAQ